LQNILAKLVTKLIAQIDYKINCQIDYKINCQIDCAKVTVMFLLGKCLNINDLPKRKALFEAFLLGKSYKNHELPKRKGRFFGVN